MITFTESSEIETEYDGVIISKYSNVSYHGDQRSSRSEHLSGNWFVIDVNSYTYYHFIFDNVGQFFALKSLIPDLKLLVRLKAYTPRDKDRSKFTAWCYEKLAVELGDDLVFAEIELLKALYIENLYVSSNSLIDFYRQMEVDKTDRLVYEEYQNFVIPRLREFFMRHISVPVEAKKIYISNRSKSSQTRDLKKYIEYVKSLGVVWESTPLGALDWDYEPAFEPFDPNDVFTNHVFPEKFDFIHKDINSLAYLEVEADSRYISEEDEDRLENFFIENGYEIVDHSTLAYEDQIRLCMSASHYATLTGSSVLNSIVCRENAHVYVLDLEPSRHKIVHEYTPTVISNNVHVIFGAYKISGLPRRRYSLDQMIEKLKEVGV